MFIDIEWPYEIFEKKNEFESIKFIEDQQTIKHEFSSILAGKPLK